MKLQALAIPEDPALLPEWLEAHLLGLDLAQLVDELEVLGRRNQHTPGRETEDLRAVLGPQLDEVLQLGLRSLAREPLVQLLRQPRLLPALQLLVLEQGGAYWSTVPASAELEEYSARTWANIESTLRKNAEQRPNRRFKPWFWASSGWLATAAALVFAFFMNRERAGQVLQLQGQLADQRAEVRTLRQELAAQHLAVARQAPPHDLPPDPPTTIAASGQPTDLPDGDPGDLPGL